MMRLGSRAGWFQRLRHLLDFMQPVHTTAGHLGLFGVILLVALSLDYGHAAGEDAETGATQSSAKTDEAAVPLDKTFALRVVGPDAKPVPEAKVELRMTPSPTAEQIKMGTFVRNGSYFTFARTDTEGRLVVEFPKAPRSFDVFIQTPGYGPYCARWSSENQPQGIPASFTAELETGWSVGGIVVDSDGKPVVGAEVSPSIEFKKRPGDRRQLASGATIKTDANGLWRFDSVPSSMKDVHVSINHSAFKSERRELTRAEFGIERSGEPAVRIPLDRGLTVKGKVTDETGRPVAGASIRTKFLNDIREVKTEEDGTYRLGGCEPRMARVVVSAQGRATDMKEVRFDAEMEPVNFQMQPGGKIRIRVLDMQDKPVPKARIFYQRWRGRIDYFEFNHKSQYADENGIWEWNEAPLDEFAADICPPNGMCLSERPLLARDEEYVFRIPPTLVVTGRVIDAETKQPIAKFQVLPGIRSNETRMNWVEGERFTATDGKFIVRQTHEYFAHLVRVEASGYCTIVSRNIKSNEGSISIDFEMQKGKNVAAKVVTPGLAPATKAKVALGVAGSQINIMNGDIEASPLATLQETDDAGRFDFPPQNANFQLVITHPSGYAYIKSTPDWDLVKIIRLEPWAKIEGTFQAGSKRLPNVPLTMNVAGPHSYGNDVPSVFTHYDTTTGPEGRFAFDRVFAGKASIGRRIMLMVNDGATDVTSSCMVLTEFTGGKTTTLALGGIGRPVIGKLQPPEGFSGKVLWNFALLYVQPALKKPPAEGPSFTVSIGRDGTFRIDDVPPGEYLMNLRFDRDRAGQLANRQLVVPAIEGKSSDEPFDLGTLVLRKE